MGFFGKTDPAEDAIENAPTSADTEKQVPSEEENWAGQPQAAVVQVDPAVEKRVLRKLDLRLPILMAFLYLLASLDRSNIGNAKTAGMEDDLHLGGNSYEWLLTIFYISYALFEVLGFMWKVIPPNMWATITVVGWGIMATCQAAAQNWSGMMALRFFLGVFEAGFGPGVPFLMSFFYRRNELGLRCGMYLAAAPLASTFAGALAYGITSGHPLLTSWRLLFLVEGVPTFIGAVLAWFFVPNSVSSTTFLTEEEKEVAQIRNLRHGGESGRAPGLSFKEMGKTLLDAKPWITSLMYFSCNVSFSSLPVFLPTILRDMGFTSVNAQGLTAPPYFLAFIFSILTTWLADRFQQRGLMIVLFSIIGAVGYVMLATCTSVGVRYAGVFLAAAGVFPCIGNILPWVLNNQGSDSARGMGIVIMNIIGQCGPFLGTNIFPSSDSPRYVKGQSICAAFMFFTTLLALGLRTLLVWENKQLDRKYGSKAERAAAGEKSQAVGEENFGADFRYVL